MTQHASQARPTTADRAARGGAGWRVLVALLVLSLIPLVSGALRLVEIAGGPPLLPVNPRIAASPAPLVLHVIGAVLYVVLGVLQFSGGLRRRRPGWHRRSGRVAAGAGLVVAGSGVWMTLFYPDAPGGALLWAVRLLVGTLTAAFIVLGVTAIRRGQVDAHRAWMIRAYALAVGAGTQAFTEGIGEATLGVNDLSKAMSMTAAWAINAAIAEWTIRRGRTALTRRLRPQLVAPRR
ncbi:DUF2306 domain-containing protein [Nocardioides panacisoli]|uniref:DUF2306 domain-containing protein n=1 Tax=Nocardioides panacisoli TaxID=627624 RepID=UPI0031CFD48D